MNRLVRALVLACGVGALWQATVWMTGVPHYILPGPVRVGVTLLTEAPLLLDQSLMTLLEIELGFALGAGLGVLSALVLATFRPARRWLLPLLVASQAVPVFAIAPLLVLWLGYGLASKIAMTTLVIYFPVAAAFFDGLRRTDPGLLDLAATMAGPGGRIGWREIRHLRLPAALPALASGLRVAAAVAPIGAIIGEWVGASSGLGFLMLHANARMQTDLVFAALAMLAALAILLHAGIDMLLRRALPWVPESLPTDDPPPRHSARAERGQS